MAEARDTAAEQARAAGAAARLGHTAVLAAIAAEVTGRRGPGLPGSAQSFLGGDASPAAGFASGQPLDVAPGCADARLVPGGRGRATMTGTPGRPMMSCSG